MFLQIRMVTSLLLFIVMVASIRPVAAEESSITVGVTLPLTGPLAEYGEWMQRGLLMGAEDFKSSIGRNLHFDFQDDTCLAGKAVANTKLFTSVKHYTLISSLCTAVAPAIAPITTDKAVVMTPSFKVSALYNPKYNHFFSLQPTIEREMETLVDLLKMKGRKRLAILANKDDFVDSYITFLKKAAEARGIEVVSEQRPLISESDYKSYLPRIKQSKADSLFISFRPSQYKTVVEQVRRFLDQKILLAGNWTMAVIASLKIPIEFTEGSIFTYHYKADGNSQFEKRYREKYGVEPEAIAAASYDIATLFGKALGHCSQDDAKCIIKWLNSLPTYDGASGRYRFQEGATTKDIYRMTFSNGKTESFADAEN